MALPRLLLVSGLLWFGLAPASAETFQTSTEYRQQRFEGLDAIPGSVWLTGTTGEIATEILGHPPASLRLRYWHVADVPEAGTVWILDEVGKEQPITIGVHIQNQQIIDLSVLEYRETRGWEVRLPGFTGQFLHAGLDDARDLDRGIDGIAGALSVRALKRMARLALALNALNQP